MAYQQQPSAWGGGYSSPLSSGAPPAYSSSGQQTFAQQNYQPLSQPQSTSSQQQQATSRTNPTTAAAQPPQQTNYGSSSANYYNNNLPSSPYYNQQQPQQPSQQSQQQGQPAQYGQVASWYQQILGRVPSYAEVQQQLHNFTPEGLSTQNMQAVLSGIQNSPEAQRYAQQHPGPPATTMPMPYQGGPPVPGAQQFQNGMWQGPDGTIYTPQGQPIPDTGPGGIAGPGRTAPNPNWDTNGYAAPGYVQAAASRYALPGFDATKWNNTNLQDPKYVVGRILSNYPSTPAGLQQAMAAISQAYPGTQLSGKDTLIVPGLNEPVDVLKGAGAGGQAWQWLTPSEVARNAAAGQQQPAAMDPTMQALQMISQQMQMPPGYAMPAAQPAAQQSSGPDNAAIQSQIAQLMSYFQQQQQQQAQDARAASLAARTPNINYY
jgi:hypothetical protein